MSHAIKAALLSALVFPGLGHFILKKPLLGSLLLGSSGLCLAFLFMAVLDIAKQLSLQLQTNEIALDVASLNAQLSHSLSTYDGGRINIALLIILVLWLIAIIDSYRLGRVQDKNDARMS